MLLLRIASACAIAYGAQEFFKDPDNFNRFAEGLGEIYQEGQDWGMHKFMGTVDPNQ